MFKVAGCIDVRRDPLHVNYHAACLQQKGNLLEKDVDNNNNLIDGQRSYRDRDYGCRPPECSK